MSIFELSNTLKTKSIKPAGRAETPKKHAAIVPQPQTPADLEKMAMEAMADLSAKFPAWASGDVQKIKQLLIQANELYDQQRTDLIRQKVYPKAHDLKGQGTTFGYPLITDIGSHMCQLITTKSNYTPKDVRTLQQDVLMMETILWKKLKGDGGLKGAEILEKLK